MSHGVAAYDGTRSAPLYEWGRPVEFRILGTVELVDDDGLAVDVGGPRERALLARLLVSANRGVSAESLAEDLWAGHPPTGCLATLRVYVSRLRRALGPAAGALVTQPPGYRLNVATDQLDAARFGQLATRGRADLVAGRPDTAAKRLKLALELWHGSALADVADLPFAGPEVTRLEEARLAALEDRVEADLHCGRHGALVGELEGLVAVHPLRERLWGQLMLALYRCGRQADALRAYRKLVAVLGDELGIDPSPELRGLESAILGQDDTLDWHPTARLEPAAITDETMRSGPVTVLLTRIDIGPMPPESGVEAALVPPSSRRADEIIRSAVATHHGEPAEPADWSEDGPTLSVFDAPIDAVAAAPGLVKAITAEPWPPGLSLRARAAIHTGHVDEHDGKLVGLVVNRTAGLLSAAHTGQVVMSQATAELVRDRLRTGAEVRDLGVHQLEGLRRPERVQQLVWPGLSERFPPLRSVYPDPAGLPAETTSFVGREAELATIADLFPLSRLVTLTGPAGSGKSRLAHRAAVQASTYHPDGVWLVQLAPIRSPDLVVPTLAAALSVREEPARSLLDSVTAHLQGREALVVLDNCEHLLDGAANLADALLRKCPSVRVLATSQVRLGVAGEATWPVPPLTVPGAGEQDLQSIAGAESVRLLHDRAALAQPGFRLTPDTAPGVREICRRLDGIPLAIELAAARLNTLTPAQLAARLDDRFRVLTTSPRADLPRHRTLRAALDWSHSLLGPAEQLCLRRMAVFAGGCTIDAVEAICPDDRLRPEVLLETVSALVDRSLLSTQERCGAMRYQMLESVHHYARERLQEAGEVREVRGRHLDWLLQWIDRADLEGLDQAAWLDLIEAEHDNIRSALAWSLDAGDSDHAEEALALAGALAPFWRIRGYFAEGRRWVDAALQAAGPDANPRLRANALDGAGQLATGQADYGAQRAYQEASLAIWRQLGDQLCVARCLVDLGFLAHVQGDYPAALALHTQGLHIARQAGDVRRIALALSGLGMLALHQDDLDRSTAYYQESMARFKEVGDLRRATLILGNLGVVARNRGDFTAARACFEEHLGNAVALGDRKLEAGALTNLGTVAQDLGDLERSAQLHRQALTITEQIGDRRIASVALTNLGLVAQARKDYPAARSFHQRSLHIADSLGEQRAIAEGLEEAARVDAAEGHDERAAKLLAASQALRERVGAPIPTPDIPRFQAAADTVRLALGDDRFREAWAFGGALPLGEAVALAGVGR